MTTYLYGLILTRNAHLVPAHIAGIDGRAVRVLPCGRLDALVSSAERLPSRATLADIQAHDHVLQSVVNSGVTAAATRFGQLFRDDEDVQRHLRQHGERIANLLEQFDGFVEMRLLMPTAGELEPAPPPPPLSSDRVGVGPGRAYLEGLRATAHQPLKGLGLRSALGPVVRAERVEQLPQDRGAVFAHLVRRDDEPTYREALAAQPALGTATIVGPLALYSFAEPLE